MKGFVTAEVVFDELKYDEQITIGRPLFVNKYQEKYNKTRKRIVEKYGDFLITNPNSIHGFYELDKLIKSFPLQAILGVELNIFNRTTHEKVRSYKVTYKESLKIHDFSKPIEINTNYKAYSNDRYKYDEKN